MSKLDFVDVARYQRDVPWNLFRDAGVNGAMARVSEGYFLPPDYTGHIDAYFATNWQALENFDLRGATHYIRFDKNRTGGLTTVDQVNLAIDEIEAQPSQRKATDIFALDVEQPASQIAHIPLVTRAAMLAAAFEEAEKRWDKEYIWLYTGKWWWNPQMPSASLPQMKYLASFHCWAAFYTRLNFSSRMVPKGSVKEDVIAHQWNGGTKKIAGISVDHNEFLFDWDTYLQIAPPVPVPPIPEPVPPTPPIPPPPEPPSPPSPPPVPPDPVLPTSTPEPTPTDPKGCLPTIIPALIELIGKRRNEQ